LRPIVSVEHELDRLAQNFKMARDPVVLDAALTMIGQLRQRGYAAFDDFRRDLMAFLEAVRLSYQALPNLSAARQAWVEALHGLRAEYWRRYLFDPETELAGFKLPNQS
jgi:hypothetical protein